MRESLAATFPRAHLLDLHGNAKKKDRAPDGGKDENVFDIQQGVAIGLFTCPPVEPRRFSRAYKSPCEPIQIRASHIILKSCHR